MTCISTQIPKALGAISDVLKAIDHSKNVFCVWVLNTREDRNRFMDATAGMDKSARTAYYAEHFG